MKPYIVAGLTAVSIAIGARPAAGAAQDPKPIPKPKLRYWQPEVPIPPLEFHYAPQPPVVAVWPKNAEIHWVEPGSVMVYGQRLSLPEPSGRQDSAADSLYRRARETLNRGEYRQASELFRTFEQRHPSSRYVPAAMYWQAFSLYRAGTETELRTALRVLDEQKKRFPSAAQDGDVSGLVTRVVAALASRGDAEAAARVRQEASSSGQSCDKEDLQVRSDALSALVQSEPAAAADVIKRVLARQDECSAPLRRRAVYLLGREGIPASAADLVAIARSDPDQHVRRDAVSRLAQLSDGSVGALEQLFNASSDENTQRSVLNALRSVESAEANRLLRRAIEREDLAEAVRVEAIRSFGRCCGRRVYRVTTVDEAGKVVRGGQEAQTMSESDATFLRSVYEKNESRALKTAVLETMASSGGPATDQWLMSIIRNQNEELRYRNAALSRLQRSDASIEELGRLYDALSERELRSSLVSILGRRDEPAATDKLIEIVKSGTDPVIRRHAIAALGRKKDPRTTKLLLDLVEKK